MTTSQLYIRLAFLALAGMLLTACTKTDTFSEIPALSFKSLDQYLDKKTGKDSLAVLVLSFQDGDGDIGFKEGDTLPPYNPGSEYYYDLIVKYFEKKNGQFVEINLPETFNARIPYLTPEGRSKALRGDISYKIITDPFAKPNDTTRYEVYIVDRALHKSNVITTPIVVLNRQ